MHARQDTGTTETLPPPRTLYLLPLSIFSELWLHCNHFFTNQKWQQRWHWTSGVRELASLQNGLQ